MSNNKKQDRKPIFGDFGKKIQKAGRNFGNGFRSLVGVEEKPSIDHANSIAPSYNSAEEIQKAGENKLDNLESNWNSEYDEILNQYREKFGKSNERVQRRHQNRLKRMERKNRRIQEFIENQRHQWKLNQLDRKETRLQKQKGRKLERQQKFDENQVKWDRFMTNSQRGVEKMVKGVNRFGWRLQFRMILVILPLLILIIILFIFLRPILDMFV